MKFAARRNLWAAFTILELLVSFVILGILVIAVFGLLNMTSRTYKASNARLDAFETARSGFDLLSRNLRQAVLHSYWGYDNPTAPTRHLLKSDLHFVSGRGEDLGIGAGSSHSVFFQAPLGVSDSTALRQNTLLLNSAGFFIEYGEDPLTPPTLRASLPSTDRFRLHMFRAPRESMSVYDHTLARTDGVIQGDSSFAGHDWFTEDIASGRFVHAIADNVVALFIRSISESGAPDFAWNSRLEARPDQLHRLPDALDVAMVVIDEAAAERLGASAADIPPELFRNPADFEQDLQRLEAHFVGMTPPVDVRIFREQIPLSANNAQL